MIAQTHDGEEPRNKEPGASDSYNGASCESYKWSQSILDLDVLVPLPWEARCSKKLSVILESDEIEVTVLGPEGNQTLVKGRLSFKIKSSESYWCLEPGKRLSVSRPFSLVSTCQFSPKALICGVAVEASPVLI
jgi:hypothetical protein